MSTEPLHFVDNVEATVHDERVHPPCFRAEAGDTISALLGGTKFEFKERIVFCAHNAKVIRHEGSVRRTAISSIFLVGMMMMPYSKVKTLPD